MDYDELLKKLNIREEEGGEKQIGKVKDIILLYLDFIRESIDENYEKNLEYLENITINIQQMNEFIQELMELDQNMEIIAFYDVMRSFLLQRI